MTSKRLKVSKLKNDGGICSLANWLVSCGDAVDDRMNELFQYVSSRSPSMFIAYQAHMPLNRYDDFMCFDRNRVVLSDGSQTYIHANEVQLPNAGQYVLTQAPLAHTVVDFWRMVWLKKPNVIVALSEPANPTEKFCSMGEDDVHRCAPLYSIRGTSHPQHTTEKWKTVEETLSVKDTQTFALRFVLYKAWTSDRVIPPVTDMVAFVRNIKTQAEELHVKVCGPKLAKLKKQPPIIAICPTGAIRCGLLAGADAVTRAIDSQAPELNINGIVKTLRDCRYGTISTFEQYVYLYMVAAEAARQRQVPRADVALRRCTNIYERVRPHPR